MFGGLGERRPFFRVVYAGFSSGANQRSQSSFPDITCAFKTGNPSKPEIQAGY
jgi:hypothetical protein